MAWSGTNQTGTKEQTRKHDLSKPDVLAFFQLQTLPFRMALRVQNVGRQVFSMFTQQIKNGAHKNTSLMSRFLAQNFGSQSPSCNSPWKKEKATRDSRVVNLVGEFRGTCVDTLKVWEDFHLCVPGGKTFMGKTTKWCDDESTCTHTRTHIFRLCQHLCVCVCAFLGRASGAALWVFVSVPVVAVIFIGTPPTPASFSSDHFTTGVTVWKENVLNWYPSARSLHWLSALLETCSTRHTPKVEFHPSRSTETSMCAYESQSGYVLGQSSNNCLENISQQEHSAQLKMWLRFPPENDLSPVWLSSGVLVSTSEGFVVQEPTCRVCLATWAGYSVAWSVMKGRGWEVFFFRCLFRLDSWLLVIQKLNISQWTACLPTHKCPFTQVSGPFAQVTFSDEWLKD